MAPLPHVSTVQLSHRSQLQVILDAWMDALLPSVVLECRLFMLSQRVQADKNSTTSTPCVL
jgi:hypothetical protein